MNNNKTILIVDDDQDFIDAYTLILKKENYTVESAMSSAEGLVKTKKLNPNLIILDIMMENPDSGFEFAQQLRDDDINIPIILSSSIASASQALFDTNSLNVKTILQKPVNFENLLKQVAKYIR